jgi:anti-anti-sigma factor
MELTVETIEHGIKRIALAGRMDIVGTERIGLRLTSESAANKALILLDLSRVDYMSSIGIGVLVSTAKAVGLRGGRIVLFNPQPMVEMVLTKTKIDSFIPIHQTLAAACHALRDASPRP